VVVLAAGVGGRDEAIEGVACPEQSRRVGVADDAVGGGQGCTQRRGAGAGSGKAMSGAAKTCPLPR
jgi:hypothetical protein